MAKVTIVFDPRDCSEGINDTFAALTKDFAGKAHVSISTRIVITIDSLNRGASAEVMEWLEDQGFNEEELDVLIK